MIAYELVKNNRKRMIIIMKICAIIAEYNPFHNGHKYQIEKAKELTGCDSVLVLMSGSFVQRGSPAIYNKWDRSLMAIDNGADLILELPVIYATSSAEYFATRCYFFIK